nr:hypothetical protein [Tanacetum cinerariifolium]
MLAMRSLLRTNHMLRMLHLLPNHLSMVQSLILRRIQRTMTTRILPINYPADGGDDGDDEEESSEDDEDEEDDEIDVEADEEEEEEHPAPADSVVVAPTDVDQALSAEETEPFETDESAATPPPHPAYRTT